MPQEKMQEETAKGKSQEQGKAKSGQPVATDNPPSSSDDDVRGYGEPTDGSGGGGEVEP
jgi:hypothetical protein